MHEKILKRRNYYLHIDQFPDEIHPLDSNCEMMKRVHEKNKMGFERSLKHTFLEETHATKVENTIGYRIFCHSVD
jgi:hypothetical protein